MRITVGMLLMAAALATGSSCARPDWIDRTLVTVDVTGTWAGTVAGNHPDYGAQYTFNLEQQGSHVKGSMNRSGIGPHSAAGPIDGTIAGDVFSFRQTNGSIRGELKVSGDEMNGQISGRGIITLRRVDASSPPRSPMP